MMKNLVASWVLISVFGASAIAADVAKTDWEKVDTTNGIQVFKREVEGNPVIALKGVGEVDAPLEKVASVILDRIRATEWVDRLKEQRVLKMYSPHEFLQISHIGTPIVLRDRDFVCRGKVEFDLKARWIQLTLTSTEDLELAPVKDQVRGALNGFYRMEELKGGTKTLVTAEMHADPKGSVPKWIVNLVQKSWPKNTIERLRKQVAKSDVKIIPEVQQVIDSAKP